MGTILSIIDSKYEYLFFLVLIAGSFLIAIIVSLYESITIDTNSGIITLKSIKVFYCFSSKKIINISEIQEIIIHAKIMPCH